MSLENQNDKNIGSRLTNFLIKQRLSIFLFTIIIAAFFSYSASKIKFREDILELIPQDDEVVAQYKNIIMNFKFADKIFISVGARGEGSISEGELAAAGDKVADALTESGMFSKIIYERDVSDVSDAIEFMQGRRANYFTSADFDKINAKLSPQYIDSALKNWRKILSESPNPILAGQFKKDPLGLDELLIGRLEALSLLRDSFVSSGGRIFDKDLKHLLIIASPRHPATDSFHAGETTLFLEKAFKKISAEDKKIRIAWTGGQRFSYENSMRIKRDLKVIIIISIIAIAALCFIAFRRPLIILYTFIPAFFGGIVAAGAIKWLIPDISAITLGSASVVLGICVDYGIHILYHCDNYRDGLRDRFDVFRSLRGISLSLTLCAGTTITAFLTLQFSELPMYRDLGMFASIGVFASLLFSLFVLPLIIPPHKKNTYAKNADGENQRARIDIILRYIFKAIDRHQTIIAVIVMIVTGLAIWGLMLLRFDGDIRKLNFVTKDMKSDMEAVSASFGDTMGSSSIVVKGASAEEALVRNEQINDEIEKMKRDGRVKTYGALSEILPSAAKQKINIEAWKKFWSGEKIENLKRNIAAASEKYKIKPEAFDEFYKSLKADYVPFDCHEIREEGGALLRDAAEEFMIVKSGASYVMTPIVLKNPDDIRGIRGELTEGKTFVALFDGRSFIEHIVGMIYDELIRLGGLVMCVNLFFLLMATRSIKATARIVFPLLIALLWTFGLMGLFGIQINLMTSIIVIFIFGLVDDYSIFMAEAWRGRGDNDGHSLSLTGGAIIFSALTTLAGFIALAFGKYPPFRLLGISASLGIVCGMVAVFLIVPLQSRKAGK